ncbi:MAG TPA: hypothetical protein VER96_37620 [Polyangiaceae bacterium]|nr:hypothetical protein [Polyangiaceae bacterium]
MSACHPRFIRRASATAICAGFVVVMPALAAAEGETEQAEPSMTRSVQTATQSGQFLPLALSPSVGPNRALASGFGGYDSAAQAPRFESFAEARVYGPFALRFGAHMRSENQTVAPSITGRVQILSQAKHGFDGGVAVAYKAEGFTEPEGEIEVLIAAARTFGSWRLVGNLAYGQDPEGHERDGEVRAAALCHLGTLYYLGLDSRVRVDLGEENTALKEHEEAKFDFDVGPAFHIALGPLALSAHAGVSGTQRGEGNTRVGFVGMAGLGTAL